MSASAQFDSIIEKLPMLLENLQASPLLKRNALSDVPQAGIYVFYDEAEVPIYVGRSNRMRSRLLEHGRQSPLHNSATFAFILAGEEGRTQRSIFPTQQRELLQKIPEFRDLFLHAKERVRGMTVRVIGIKDPIEQTISRSMQHSLCGRFTTHSKTIESVSQPASSHVSQCVLAACPHTDDPRGCGRNSMIAMWSPLGDLGADWGSATGRVQREIRLGARCPYYQESHGCQLTGIGTRPPRVISKSPGLQRTNVLTLVQKPGKLFGGPTLPGDYEVLCSAVHPSWHSRWRRTA